MEIITHVSYRDCLVASFSLPRVLMFWCDPALSPRLTPLPTLSLTLLISLSHTRVSSVPSLHVLSPGRRSACKRCPPASPRHRAPRPIRPGVLSGCIPSPTAAVAVWCTTRTYVEDRKTNIKIHDIKVASSSSAQCSGPHSTHSRGHRLLASPCYLGRNHLACLFRLVYISFPLSYFLEEDCY